LYSKLVTEATKRGIDIESPINKNTNYNKALLLLKRQKESEQVRYNNEIKSLAREVKELRERIESIKNEINKVDINIIEERQVIDQLSSQLNKHKRLDENRIKMPSMNITDVTMKNRRKKVEPKLNVSAHRIKTPWKQVTTTAPSNIESKVELVKHNYSESRDIVTPPDILEEIVHDQNLNDDY